MIHALLPPSSAGQFIHCPGSVHAQQMFPEDETQESREGVAAHWVCSESLLSYQGIDGIRLPSSFVGKTAPNDVVITDEMSEAAHVFVIDVLRVINQHALLTVMQVEETVRIDRVNIDNWGTPDVRAYDLLNRVLYVWDFKYGHRTVSAFENWQLIDYSIGAVDEVGIDDDLMTVEMRIIQPRNYRSGPVDHWRIPATDLRGYANRLTGACNEALSDDPTFTTGDHCLYCSARHKCDGAQRAAMNAVDVSQIPFNIIDMPPEAVGLELSTLTRAASALENRITGLKAVVESSLIRGSTIPGWTMKSGNGRQKWTLADAEMIAMGNLLGVDLRSTKTITPNNARASGVDEAVIKAYSITPSSGIKLIQDDESLVRRVFYNQEEIKDD